MTLAGQHGAKSIAFPAISTGIYGYPLHAASAIAVDVVRGHGSRLPGLEQVIFACFSDEALAAYRALGVPA